MLQEHDDDLHLIVSFNLSENKQYYIVVILHMKIPTTILQQCQTIRY